jgi:ADP-ribose pyrophosphatase
MNPPLSSPPDSPNEPPSVLDDALPAVSHFEEKTLDSRIVFQGRIATVRVDNALHPSGMQVAREVVEHPGGVVVCPVLDDGRIVMVAQWRYPLRQTLLELPAGKLDWTDGVPEDPVEAIRRELWEETGYKADEWEELTHVYTAPGFCNEKLWLYRASRLKNGHKTHQPSEHEWLDVVRLTPEEAFDKIRRREITDAKTIALLCLCFAFPGGFSQKA